MIYRGEIVQIILKVEDLDSIITNHLGMCEKCGYRQKCYELGQFRTERARLAQKGLELLK